MDFRDRNRTVVDDNRPGFPRALVFSLGVGLAFGGGLIAGGVADTRVELPAREPDDPVARAEARTRAYEAVVKAQQLTWHHELTEPDAPLPTAPALAKASSPSPKDPAATDTHDAPAAAEAPKAADPPIEDKALRTPEPEAVPEPVKRAPTEGARDARVDRDDEAGGDVVTRPDPKKLDEAFARVVGDKGAAAPTKRYAVQLASVPSADVARAEAERWKKRGVNVSIVSAEVAGKGTMYRVRVTGLSSKDAATAKKGELGEGIIVAE
jgi:cell division septation protein DedD